MVFGINKEVVERMVKEFGLQTAVDKIPTALAGTIQPVFISNPERIANIVRANTIPVDNGSVGLYQTPAVKREFYLTGYTISGNSGGGLGTISVTIDGAVQVLVALNTQATGNQLSGGLVVPIRLDADSEITLTTDAASTPVWGSIQGYTVDIL